MLPIEELMCLSHVLVINGELLSKSPGIVVILMRVKF